jgi:Zn finger protein HypA/HybF involved in hydrogenase expression
MRVTLPTATCAACGTTFAVIPRERHRRPCPRCHSTARLIGRTATESMSATDRAS